MEFLGVEYQLGLWDNETLGRIVAIDTETTYITHPSITPDLVTFQAFGGDDRVYFIDRTQIGAFFKAHENSQFVFHNAAFDIDVIIKTGQMSKQYFEQKVEDYKVWDTSILYRLWRLGVDGNVPFKHNLALLTKELLGSELEKDDAVRCNFGEYYCNGETYWEHIPDEFMDYAARDAVATFYCYQQLANLVARTGSHSYQTHLIQLAGDIALSRISKRGIGFDVFERNKMVEQIREMMRTQEDILASYGWTRGQKGIQERYEYIVKDLLNLDLPKTADGHISMKSEDLEPYKENHPFVRALCTFLELEHKVQYIEPLTENRIHPRYDLIKNTGRTGASKPNIQNPPRSGGIRELFVPKPGYTFSIVDYSFVELCTLAQTTYHKYGASALRDAINQGIDPHKYYASILTGKNVKDVTKDERQKAKACFSLDTELLTEQGWLNIEKVKEIGCKIAQWDESGYISFVNPSNWVVNNESTLILMDYGTVTQVTKDHRVPMITRNGALITETAEEITSKDVSHRNFIKSGVLRDIKPTLDDSHTRLAVAVAADGTYFKQGNRGRVSVKKEGKANRFRELLAAAGVQYTESFNNERWHFHFNKQDIFLNVSTKGFLPIHIYQADAFFDELYRWDGSDDEAYKIYRTTNKESVDAVQELAVLNGYITLVSTYLTGYSSKVCYTIRYKKGFLKRSSRKPLVTECTGPSMCCSVPSTYLVTRYKNSVSISGNCMFGFPGGLGVEKFVEYASTSYGVSLTTKEAERLKDVWFKAYPEMVQYMRETGSDAWTITGRKRADASYCAAKNTPFQGLAADGAKIAMWELEKAGYNTVAFIHDEIICEIPLDKAEESLENIKRIMIDAMSQVCPDVKIGVDGHLTDRWRKL